MLFLFVVALLPPGGMEPRPAPSRLVAGGGVGLALLAALVLALFSSGALPSASSAVSSLGNVADIGHQLFDTSKLVVPFELTAPLLLVAIIGAVALWRRQEAAL